MTRRLWSVEGNRQRLDGGAMFGNAPRALWQRWAEPDGDNRIALACRAMLVDDGERRILFETGIGAFFAPELRARYGVEEERHVLLDGLTRLGLSHEQIDVVVLSHLHFDHAGGLLAAYRAGAPPELLFPRATYVASREAFERSQRPHDRDRASFIAGLDALLLASGRLELCDRGGSSTALGADYRLHFSDGHTPGLMLAEVPSAHGPIVFTSDLVPGAPWVHLPITMGYDRFPERLIDEKRSLFSDILARRGRLFFTHDPEVALARLTRDERGRYGTIEPLSSAQSVPL